MPNRRHAACPHNMPNRRGQRKPRTAYALRHWQSTMTAMQPCASSWQVSGTVQHRDLGAHQSHAAALRKGGLRGVQRVADHGGAAAAGCPGWLRQPVAHISTLSHDCKCNTSGRLPTVELLQPLHSRLSKDPTAPCISTHLHWCVRPAILADLNFLANLPNNSQKNTSGCVLAVFSQNLPKTCNPRSK